MTALRSAHDPNYDRDRLQQIWAKGQPEQGYGLSDDDDDDEDTMADNEVKIL